MTTALTEAVALEDFEVVRPLQTKPGTFIAICPHCEDRSGHAEVDERQRVYYCHRCGTGGRVLVPSDKTIRYYIKGPERSRELGWPTGTPIKPHDQPYWKYLSEGRDFPDPIISKLEPYRGPNPHYIYFPFHGLDGEVRYWSARTWADAPRKWLFPQVRPGKSQFLYNLRNRFLANVGNEDPIILVEGIFDAIWSPYRLAIMGTTLSSIQMSNLLAMGPRSIYLALDSDAVGQAYKICSDIARTRSIPLYVCKLPEGDDPDSLSRKEPVSKHVGDFLLDFAERYI